MTRGAATPVATLERVCFLEWRIEQLTCALEDKDRLLQQQRVQLAEGAARDAEAATRVSDLERLLAEARREAVLLGDQRSVQADLEERLGDAERGSIQAARLVRELERERERLCSADRALELARDRITILESGRERFFAKLIQWQQLGSGQGNADLAQFIAELRAEVSRLASENATLSERESALLRELDALRRLEPPAEAAEPPALQGQGREVAPVRARAFVAPHAGPEPAEDTGSHQDDRAGTTLDEIPAMGARAASQAESAAQRASRSTTGEAPPPSAERSTGDDVSQTDAAGPDAPLSFAEVRAQLAIDLGSSSRARHAERLLFELFGANVALRRGAARAMLHLAGPHAASALVLAFHTATDAVERVELLGLMARCGSDRVRGAIEGAHGDLEGRVRAAALDALAQHARRDPEVMRGPLERALADPEARVRRRAVMVLCAQPRLDAAALLAKVLCDPDPHLRRAACAGLVQIQDPSVQRLLAGALLDPEPAVRRAAASALRPVFGDEVTRMPDRSESERRRGVALLRERIADRDSRDASGRPLATRLFDGQGRNKRVSERGVRSGPRSGRPILAAGLPRGGH